MKEPIHDQADLDRRLAALKHPDPDGDCLYHAITLTADNDFNVEVGMHTEWVGYTDDDRHEIRQSRLVYGDYVMVWESIGLPYAIFHTLDEIMLFLLGGGNALVKRELAEDIFARVPCAAPGR